MQPSRYFNRTDWISFGAAAFFSELVNLLTLTPAIGLRNDGYSATAALYGGVAMPAGFPVWSAWAWIVAKCLPFGSVGWRAAFATSLCAALASGIIALLVSRLSASLLEAFPNASLVRAAAGASAGLNFGFNYALWRQAVIPDPWPMTNFLLCLTFSFFLRWSAQPERRSRLYPAAFFYALTLTNSQICLALAPAIPFAVYFFDSKLGRDLFLTGAVMYVIALCHLIPGLWPTLRLHNEIGIFNTFGFVFLMAGSAVAVKTRQLLSEWRALLACLGGFILGLVFILDLPFVGMTNPPGNWGYPRTPEGFFHVITRGQYDLFEFTNGARKFLTGIECYFQCALEDLGWPALFAALIPSCFWRRLDPSSRKTLFSLITCYTFLTLLMIAVLQPTPDRPWSDLCRMYYSVTYISLSIIAGLALVLLAKFFGPSAPHRVIN